jgi:recombinational DNA repair protein (RecF pathway)
MVTLVSPERHRFCLYHRIHPMAPIELTMAQTFEVERLKRDIDAQNDPAALRALAKDLLKAWFSEKASTNQAIQDQLKA